MIQRLEFNRKSLDTVFGGKPVVAFALCAVLALGGLAGTGETARAMDGVCVKFCDGGSSGGGSGGGGGGSRFFRGPTADEQRYALHQRGYAAYRAGDYAKAVRLFEEALDKAFGPVTRSMLLKSRLWLSITTARTAYDSRQYSRALRFRREALRQAEAVHSVEPSETSANNVQAQKSWIRDLERLAAREKDKQRWESAVADSRGRVAAVLDDLQDRIAASPDFASPETPVAPGGGLTLMTPGSEAFKPPASRPATPPVKAAVVNPADLKQGPHRQRGLKIKPVPAPTPKAIGDEWVRMNAQKPPDMILEALQEGRGDLAASVLYMRERLVRLNPEDREAREALSYLEALYLAEKTFNVDSLGEGASSDSRHLINAMLSTANDGRLAEVSASDDGTHKWRMAREFAVRKAMDEADGDVDRAIDLLSRRGAGENAFTDKAAIRFLQGLSAFRHLREVTPKQ